MLNKNWKLLMTIVAIAVMFVAMGSYGAIGSYKLESGSQPQYVNSVTSSALNSDLVLVYHRLIPAGSVAISPYNGNMHVMVTFSLSNTSRLSSFLQYLSDPESPLYHNYITRSEFAANFSPTSSFYNSALSYFANEAPSVTSFADRISLVINANGSTISKIFHTTVNLYKVGTTVFYATGNASLPAWIAENVSAVSGLQNYIHPFLLPLFESQMLPITNIVKAHGYPVPENGSGLLPGLPANQTIQWLYGSDMQVAYDEQSLFNITYAKGQVAATILWAGCNAEQQHVAPFVPSDIYTYYNLTIPSGEPHAKVYGVPVNGAAPPGPSAANDTTGADLESTLDLEMLGSMAPGASIYEVYGPNATNEEINQAFAFILNPNSTYSALNHVDVISNSYGEAECNDTAWYEYLQEAQARGISVLASSGDTGDNPTSVDYAEFELGDACNGRPGDLVASPAAQSYSDFGVTAVGGTTVILNDNVSSDSFLHIVSDTAWYWNLTEGTELGYAGAAGSEGGISEVFSEPAWQLDSEANTILQGQGRGVPDIAAIANDTLIYITDSVEGSGLLTTSGFETVAGTSVASPTEAGIVTEIDAVLQHENHHRLGFLNPLVYLIGDLEVEKLSSSFDYQYSQTGIYNSSLPVLPLMIIRQGHNYVYQTTYAYSLVTGFGTIDATNFTSYLLSSPVNPSPFNLAGIMSTVDIEDINGTTYYFNNSTGTYQAYTGYNETLLQSFFVANVFGIPIYKVSNYLKMKENSDNTYTVQLESMMSDPLSGFGYNGKVTLLSVLSPVVVSVPINVTINSFIESFSGFASQAVATEVSIGSYQQSVVLQAPDSSYIVGALNYTYSDQGITYTNSPFSNSGYNGGFAPELTLVSGKSGGIVIMSPETAIKVNSYIERLGALNYINANTSVFGLTGSRTSSMSTGLEWLKDGNSVYVSVKSGSVEQGILFFAELPKYEVTFNETGLPSGSSWSVQTEYMNLTSNTDTIRSYFSNGTYSYSVYTSNKIYSPVTTTGTFSISGSGLFINVKFVQTRFPVVFNETGLPSNTAWYVNISGSTFSSSTSDIIIYLANGTYSYTVSSSNPSYTPSVSSGNVQVLGSGIQINVTFFGILSDSKISANLSHSIPGGTYAVLISVIAIVSGGVIVTIRKMKK